MGDLSDEITIGSHSEPLSVEHIVTAAANVSYEQSCPGTMSV